MNPLQYRLTQRCYCLPRGTNWLFWFFFRLSAGAESFFFVFGILSGQLQPFMYRGHMLKIVCFIAVILLSGCAGVGIGASGGSEGVSAGIGTGIGF